MTTGPQTFLHYAVDGNVVNNSGTYSLADAPYGFNLADVSNQSDADNLPSQYNSILYLGATGGLTTAFENTISATASDPRIIGYNVAKVDSTNAANVKSEIDYIHANAPGKFAFITASNSGSPTSPSYYATPTNTDADYVTANVWPATTSGFDTSIIGDAVSTLETDGWNVGQIIPSYQAEGNVANFAVPTQTQEEAIISAWGSVVPTPKFDYAQTYGVVGSDTAIQNDTTLQAVFSAHNTLNAPSTSLHYSPNGNFANGNYDSAGDPGSDGFNLADVSSQSLADSLPTGDKALMFLPITGDTSGFESTIGATASDSNIYGYYLADDATSSDTANLKAEVDYIHTNAPTKMVFILPTNTGSDTSPVAAFGPSAVDMTTSKDLVGVDPYPVQSGFSGGMNLDIINDRVTAWENAGWSDSQMVPWYQAFGNYGSGDWVMPTDSQEVALMNRWQDLLPNPAFDIAYSWGEQTPSGFGHDTALVDSASLQKVFAAHNS